LTDIDKNWHNDAPGTPTANQLNLKIQNGRHPPSSKIEKSQCILNRLTNFDDIWRGNAFGPQHQSGR